MIEAKAVVPSIPSFGQVLTKTGKHIVATIVLGLSVYITLMYFSGLMISLKEVTYNEVKVFVATGACERIASLQGEPCIKLFSETVYRRISRQTLNRLISDGHNVVAICGATPTTFFYFSLFIGFVFSHFLSEMDSAVGEFRKRQRKSEFCNN